MVEYEPVIGMEAHAELQTRSKMFCGCAVGFGGAPNTRCCPVCIGLPGSLPVLNERAVEFMAKAALALNCEVVTQCIFHRKNYYYPDLPKNYQISQYDNPLGINGYVEITVGDRTKKIAIRRVHMEEDTGKLLHIEGGKSLVDYNRSGVPLMEIVTQNPPPPGLDQIESADEAREYLQNLRRILVYLGVSDCKMEEGSLRCEPNVSIRPKGESKFGTKTEIKNLNSFRAVHLGVQYETERQEKLLRRGERVIQETRRWDDSRGVTSTMRSKEVEQEYRYFPEPDLVPIRLGSDITQAWHSQLPELPAAKAARFVAQYCIQAKDAAVLVDTPQLAAFFDKCAVVSGNAAAVCNWITGEFLRLVNAKSVAIDDVPVTPEHLAELLSLVDSGVIHRNMAKNVFEVMFDTGKSPAAIVEEQGLKQVTDEDAILDAVNKVFASNPQEVERYKAGEEKLVGWFVGQVMRETKGKANPGLVNKLVKDRLSVI
jgi:aspartyl-tRNA(Asn)/glutamyl-tRNA(Gln) amidotransferase subunit B